MEKVRGHVLKEMFEHTCIGVVTKRGEKERGEEGERERGRSYKFALYKKPDSTEVVVNQGGALQRSRANTRSHHVYRQ